MSAGSFEVDVNGLRGIGGKVGNAAGTLRETVRGAGAGLAPAPQPGFAATAAAQAEQVWTAGLQKLAGQIEDYSESLVAAAKEYEATDKANAQKLARGGAVTTR